jgi:hypothetical protein
MLILWEIGSAFAFGSGIDVPTSEQFAAAGVEPERRAAEICGIPRHRLCNEWTAR